MQWWNGLHWEDKARWTEGHIGVDRSYASLTGREIESICPPEIKYEWMGIMSRTQAIEALKSGKTLTHRYFTSTEYIEFKDGRVRDEDGNRLGSIEDFMSYRQGEGWETGWKLLVS